MCFIVLLFTNQFTFANQDRPINIPVDQGSLAKLCDEKEDRLTESQKQNSRAWPIHHKAITISYNLHHRNPNWVFHSIAKENLMNSCGKRSDNFRSDTMLQSDGLPDDLILTEKSFRNSGFDRGHMAPSGDFRWSSEIDKESFFMTNMSPQAPGLNQKTWNNLEMHIRNWACGMGEVKVYTGPVLKEGLPRLESCVSVPEQFFKVVMAYDKNHKPKAIAFLYNQADTEGDPVKEKAISVRKLEEITGLDFFENDFSKKSQDEFETVYNIEDWLASEENCTACNGQLKGE